MKHFPSMSFLNIRNYKVLIEQARVRGALPLSHTHLTYNMMLLFFFKLENDIFNIDEMKIDERSYCCIDFC